MKYVQSALLFTFISLFLLSSCGKKDERKPISSSTEGSLIIAKKNPVEIAESILSTKVIFTLTDDSLNRISGVYEDSVYGIGFFTLNPVADSNRIIFKSKTYDGIGEGSIIDAITLNQNEKFIYFNSGTTFIGSQNFEVFQYLFSPESKNIFTSYTTISKSGDVNFVFSKNVSYRGKFIEEFFKEKIRKNFIEDLSEKKLVTKYE